MIGTGLLIGFLVGAVAMAVIFVSRPRQTVVVVPATTTQAGCGTVVLAILFIIGALSVVAGVLRMMA